jgi:2-polyprenyl-3-methyl-5-hydroxy-6-metoxy-1,4-benzoquinol methylase
MTSDTEPELATDTELELATDTEPELARDDRAGPPPLTERLLASATGTLELFGVYLGDRLGLYDALHRLGPMTEAELAEAAGIAPRYAREWLEQQTGAAVLAVDDPSLPAEARRYDLPEEHVGVVADPTSMDYLAPFGRMMVGVARVLDEVAAAYRSGGGVPYAAYGAEFRSGQGAINRPAFTTSLVQDWIPAAATLTERLEAGGSLVDVGCGQGWSSMAVAAAFPTARVWGIDADCASIDEARELATSRGVDVRFLAADAAELADHGPFDGALILETLHDLARPVELLSAVRRSLAPGGCVLIADEAVAESFTGPGDELERMMYGWSIVHCLPASMAESPSAAIGTVIRPSTVEALAREAGFGVCEVLDVDGGFFRIYRLAV